MINWKLVLTYAVENGSNPATIYFNILKQNISYRYLTFGMKKAVIDDTCI